MCSHDPQTRDTPPKAADTPLAVVLFVLFIEQSVLSSIHCDIIAAQQRAGENAPTVVHLSCIFHPRAGCINTGIHPEFVHILCWIQLNMTLEVSVIFAMSRCCKSDDGFSPPKAPLERAAL